MTGYTPGEQPKPGERVIKLNTNENPFGPSPRVLEAIRSVDPEWLRRYPPPMADRFREAAGQLHGVPPECILAGNGSDDILQIALRTFCSPGDTLAAPEPTYSLYPVLARLADVRMVAVPWEPGWTLPIDALLEAQPRAIFFANPNAPSGTVVAQAEVEALARWASGLVLVDEAYVDFADAHCLDLVKRCGNVLVARTLSKGYGLAGLRFGYAVGDPAVIAQMTKVKDSYNCDAIAIAAACAALDDQEYARRTWMYVREERDHLATALSSRGFTVVPSHANFLFVATPGGRPAKPIYASLKRDGVLVRYFDLPGLEDKLRITIGTREHHAAFLAALDRALVAPLAS